MSDIVDGQLIQAATASAWRTTASASATAHTDAAATLAILPRVGLRIRIGTLADVALIDRVQKAHGRELGFLPTMAIEGKVRLGQVLVAERVDSGKLIVDREEQTNSLSSLSTLNHQLSTPSPVGYLIAADRYHKRDEVGYVTQIGVLPEYRRYLVAAALLQAQFDRSAYGCKLYSCWCAQDLKANEFWEAMGFTPIAFRTGSRTKGRREAGDVRREKDAAAPLTPHASPLTAGSAARIHIFWQKRIRENDTATPWWYPAQTTGGEMREDRLVFPIPPGVGWRDVLPVVLPENPIDAARLEGPIEPAAKTKRKPVAKFVQPVIIEVTQAEYDAAREAIRERMRTSPPAKPQRPPGLRPGAMWFVPNYQDYQPNELEIEAECRANLEARWNAEHGIDALKAAKKAEQKAARKVDARLVAMARELRDRWSEQTHAVAALPGKHDVRRNASPAMITEANGPLTIEAAPRLALPDAA